METTMSSSERPFKKRSSWNKTRIFFTGLAIIGTIETAGAVITEQTNNIPVNAQTLITDFMWPKTLLENTLFKEKAPSTFDRAATRSIIEAGVNTVSATNEDLKKTYEQQVSQSNDRHPTVIFPVTFTAPGQRINYEYAKPLVSGTDQTGQPVIQEFPGTITLQLSKDVKIPVIAENVEVFQFQHEIIDGKEYFVGVFMKFQQNGELYGLRIAPADVRVFNPLGGIAEAPIVPVKEKGGLDLSAAKNGLNLPLGTIIADSNLSDAIVYLNFDKYNPETNRWESIRPNFVTVGPDGQKKLLVGK